MAMHNLLTAFLLEPIEYDDFKYDQKVLDIAEACRDLVDDFWDEL